MDEEKGPLERRKRRCDDNIKTNLREIVTVSSTSGHELLTGWPNVLNTVMNNLRFLYTGGSVLIRWAYY
jgi:hypothetical protein